MAAGPAPGEMAHGAARHTAVRAELQGQAACSPGAREAAEVQPEDALSC